MANSWRPEVIADDTGKWVGNSLRFATKEEAEGNVADLYARWSAVRQTRVVESDDPVNYTWSSTNRGRETQPLPRTGGLEVTAITDVDAFIADLTGRRK